LSSSCSVVLTLCDPLDCSAPGFPVPWITRRSNQSILKEISPEYSLEGLMLKLKLHYFGHRMQRASSLEKTLMPGKIEGIRRRGRQRMGQETLERCSPGGRKESTQLSSWMTTAMLKIAGIPKNHLLTDVSLPPSTMPGTVKKKK